ncbi:UNVERIFIED_CONTAM: hypothetical protein Slati_0976200 [Sesamum latifolium]|uniref:Reverse transcriptase zinc-binding domain-containing protein n=1 Tax=Sesamum latifolium TaxID=2727402 RepID=A0AAW2XQS2_9LAMI
MDWWIPRPLSFQIITALNTLYSEATIAVLLDEAGEWKETLIRAVFRPDVVDAILGITANSESPDHLRWHYEKNGRYSVKSGYRLLHQGLVPFVHGRGRVRHLIRLRIGNLYGELRFLPSNLARRGVNIGSVCPRCGFEEENVFHSLLWCQFARLVWALSNLPWAVISCDYSDPEAWMRGMFHRLEGAEVARVLLICWFLWGTRNKLYFENVAPSASAILKQVRSWERVLFQEVFA